MPESCGETIRLTTGDKGCVLPIWHPGPHRSRAPTALDPKSSRARILELEEEVAELREKLASAVWQLEAYRRTYGDYQVVE